MGKYNPEDPKDPDYCPCGIGIRRHLQLQKIAGDTAIQMITARKDPALVWKLIENVPVENGLEDIQEAMTVMGGIVGELVASIGELTNQLDQFHDEPGGWDKRYQRAILIYDEMKREGRLPE